MSAAHRVRLNALNEDTPMKKILRIIKKDEKNSNVNEIDDYIDDPEESLKILEKIREEAMVLLYGNKTSFQRTVNVTRRQ
jgi:hypothetical protein